MEEVDLIMMDETLDDEVRVTLLVDTLNKENANEK